MKRVAFRKFTDTKTGRRIVASIYAPRRAGKDWACALVIRGLRKPIREKVLGVDSLQALQLAIEGVRYFLEQTGRPIALYEVGDHGIYRPLMGYNLAMTQHLERLVLGEITRIVRSRRLRRRFKNASPK